MTPDTYPTGTVRAAWVPARDPTGIPGEDRGDPAVGIPPSARIPICHGIPTGRPAPAHCHVIVGREHSAYSYEGTTIARIGRRSLYSMCRRGSARHLANVKARMGAPSAAPRRSSRPMSSPPPRLSWGQSGRDASCPFQRTTRESNALFSLSSRHRLESP
jgi:hypothetical protein